MSLSTLSKKIQKCKKCELWRARERAVPGEGPENAEVMLIGEAPGKQEDLAGKPFVGLSGRFLTKELRAVGLDRSKFFITGLVKCRPPGNRTPKKEEIRACLPWTLAQIKEIKPKVAVLLGKVAQENLPNTRGITYIEAPHPAAAMRFPSQKEKFRKALRILKDLHPQV